MSSYHINDLDHYPKTYSFLPNNQQDKDENGENLMTQSLVIQAPYRRIRHPELMPVILNRDREERNYDIMSQSLIVPPYRRVRHNELIPVLSKEHKIQSDVRRQGHSNGHSIQPFKAPKRAFSMTRLDQLARPRQRYLEEALKLRASKTKENLCYSSVRPTSSMSLASKQPSPKSTNNSTLNHTSNHNQSSNTNTILLRQRTSATRKQRPISYAGYSSNHSGGLNQDVFSRLSVKAQQTNGNVSSRNVNNTSAFTRNLMTSSIDGTMLSSLSKPTPPKKPAHIKSAAAARKLAKQQRQQNVNHVDNELDRIKKSDSAPRISHLDGNIKEKMKKSITNPEKITELLDETSADVQQSNELVKDADLQNEDKNQNEDKISNEVAKNVNGRFEVKPNEDLKFSEDVKSDENVPAPEQIFNDQDNISINTFVVDKSDHTIESFNEERVDEVNQATENELELLKKTEEEEQEKRRIENEEAKRRSQEEEKKRLAREEKERELERKVKEKAEKARLEMEERLRRDEQERIERKKRLDAIMSRTRKNPQKTVSPNAEQPQQTTPENANNDKQPNPDVVEDAIKSNLIKLTKNESLNSINNGKTELHNYIESETIIDNKNISLINGFKEMKMSTNSTFVFSQTSNETTYSP